MTSRFARRLQLLGTLEIGGALVLLILAGALLAFGSYVRTLLAEERSAIEAVTAQLASARPAGVREAAADVARIYLPRDVAIVLLDANARAVVARAPHATTASVDVGSRIEGPPPGERSGPLAMPVAGLATALGLAPMHGRSDGIDAIARPTSGALVSAAAGLALPAALAILAALVLAYAMTRALVAQIVRPLVGVQRALERFAAGDLTPQPIAADAREDFGALAVAFNGAIAQVEHAFAERERALAGVRQFSADAGHQLRTPLTVIRGFIAILRKGELRSPEDAERILATMARQSAVMAALVDKLMLLDRWERDGDAAPQTVDVARFTADVVGPIAEAAAERTIDVDAPPGPLAAIDPSDLMHALTNLVDNALKYTPGGVRVTVASERSDVVVRVADDGPGMSAEDVRHAFDRFYRGARRDVEGSGLGLAIARRAIERAGGSLALASDPATGTTFTIRLPAVAAPAAAPGSMEPPVARPAPALRA